MNVKLAIPSYQPLYGQIKALLVNSLASGEWKPGEMIPSEVELASRFGVSQGTVRKAIDELATDNLLMRRQGRGTFVATHANDTNTTRFLRLRAADGSEESHSSRLIRCAPSVAGPRAAAMLQIAEGSAVVEIDRLLLFAGEPLIHDHIVLPGEAFSGLDAAAIEAWEGSMYSLFETRFGVRLIRAVEHLTAVPAPGSIAALLTCRPDSPLLAVERVAYTYDDAPMEWRVGHYNTATHHYVTALD
ncbi:MAG: GntR family transcriptional regulator [Betaproteobacteria bacterium]|nr:GntR family transcriptional regulator [Betaproteobacteria bacterium]